MKILLFGDPQECERAGNMLRGMQAFEVPVREFRHVSDMEEFDVIISSWLPSLVIVLADGATGMESVYRSRQRRPDLPVFWFSNDREFCLQSYRLDCAYFSTKPVTEEKITHAVHRCQHIGIPLVAM